MRAPRLRCRPSARLLATAALLAACLAYCYYSLPNYRQKVAGAGDDGEKASPVMQPPPPPVHAASAKFRVLNRDVVGDSDVSGGDHWAQMSPVEGAERRGGGAGRAGAGAGGVQQCGPLRESEAVVDTVAVFPHFDFQPSWIRNMEFWDKWFEDRYESTRNDTTRPTLEVIVVPHSHNDPGWLMTFEQYLELRTSSILDNVVAKLHQYKDLTFIWTEISFLSAWWERAHPIKQRALKRLVEEGRLEITGGGWVMPDEACTHYYSLIDQFIEGHMWVKEKLNASVRSGWSIDPFGHGPTVPHLLAESGLDGAVVQRIHYAWKHWLAKNQIEDFHWIGGWEGSKQELIVHNMPFDIYSIKGSCGPHPAVCLQYDFQHTGAGGGPGGGEGPGGLPAAADALLAEYARTGSLTPHNVVLIPIGDDFRYEDPREFDAQYLNYRRLFDYINARFDKYRARVRFGTPRDYFETVRARILPGGGGVPTLRGDMFVYSDIFNEARPAYWSGYFTTRPYAKQLARALARHLRAAHLLYACVAARRGRGRGRGLDAGGEGGRRLERTRERLVAASRNLGLFQHHDAITGTSKAFVMHDYGSKLIAALYAAQRAQEQLLGTLLFQTESETSSSAGAETARAQDEAVAGLQSVEEWERYGTMPRQLGVTLADRDRVVVFNPVLQPRAEVVHVPCDVPHVRVTDTRTGLAVTHQVSPVFHVLDDGTHLISNETYDLLFVAELPALTAVTFLVEEHRPADPPRTVVFCDRCGGGAGTRPHPIFDVRPLMPGDVRLENSVLELLVDRNTGFLRQIYRKDLDTKNLVQIQIGAYQSAQRSSGAYLFKPDYSSPERNILAEYAGRAGSEAGAGAGAPAMLIVSGAVATEMTTLYLPLLVHTLRIYHVEELARGVLVENTVDLEPPPKNRDTELFMRIHTDIDNGDPPVMYTDQNGFQYQKRVKVNSLGIEANYYPMTSCAWIEDERTRVSLLTAHAQGAAGAAPGRLEALLDRRALYDDRRGVGEGLVDNVRVRMQHWLLVEPAPARPSYRAPTPLALRLARSLQQPPVAMTSPRVTSPAAARSLAAGAPRALHLVSLRALAGAEPNAALLTLHRPAATAACDPADYTFSPDAHFHHIHITNITEMSLTGLHTRAHLDSLSDIVLKPMDIKTYKIWF